MQPNWDLKNYVKISQIKQRYNIPYKNKICASIHFLCKKKGNVCVNVEVMLLVSYSQVTNIPLFHYKVCNVYDVMFFTMSGRQLCCIILLYFHNNTTIFHTLGSNNGW